MTRKNSAALELMKNLPASARRKLNLGDLKVLTGAVLIRDRIEQHFDQCYRSEAGLRKFKVEHGYCGGRSTCMAHTGDGRICGDCYVAMNRPNKRKNGHSEYGLLQLKKRREVAALRKGKK